MKGTNLASHSVNVSCINNYAKENLMNGNSFRDSTHAMQWCMEATYMYRLFTREDMLEFLFRLGIVLDSLQIMENWFANNKLFNYKLNGQYYAFSAQDIIDHFGLESFDFAENGKSRKFFLDNISKGISSAILNSEGMEVFSSEGHVPEITAKLMLNADLFAREILKLAPAGYFSISNEDKIKKLKVLEERKNKIEALPEFDINTLSKDTIELCMQIMLTDEAYEYNKSLGNDDSEYEAEKQRLIYLAWLWANDLMISDGEIAWEAEGVHINHDDYELHEEGINLLASYEVYNMAEVEDLLKGVGFKEKEAPLNLYFTADGDDEELLDGFPGTYDNEENVFEEIILDAVYVKFNHAWKNLNPLLEKTTINAISMGIDILPVGCGHATFFHKQSNVEKGSYGFAIKWELINEYLMEYWDNSYSVDKGYRYSWEHELTHLLDVKNLNRFDYSISSSGLQDFFIQYLLKYRNEGIAELYYFLDDDAKRLYGSGDTSRTFFREFSSMKKEDWGNPEKLVELKSKYLDSYAPYEVGPWLIIHCLEQSGDMKTAEKAKQYKKMLENKQLISSEQKLTLISMALKVKAENFLQGLVTFIKEMETQVDKTVFLDLMNHFANIENSKATEQKNVNNELIQLFGSLQSMLRNS